MLAVKSKGSVFEATDRKLVVRGAQEGNLGYRASSLPAHLEDFASRGARTRSLASCARQRWQSACATPGAGYSPVPRHRRRADHDNGRLAVAAIRDSARLRCAGFSRFRGGECDRAFDNSITGFSVPALVLALSPACSSVLLLRLRQNPAHVLQSQLGVLIDEVQPYRLPVHHRQRMAQFKARIAVIPDIE
jgi:hypothetical protein